MEFVKCTQQRGVTVCGLYATAHVTGLCCGQDQVTVLYDQAVMQSSSREDVWVPPGRFRGQELDRCGKNIWNSFLAFGIDTG